MQWILCSDRLPEVHEIIACDGVPCYESEPVLVCFKRENEIQYDVAINTYDDCEQNYTWYGVYDYYDMEVADSDVLAWLPLPEFRP